jgi:hypothetical protein
VCVRAHHQLVVSIGPTPPPSAEYDRIEYATLPVDFSIFANAVSHNVIRCTPFWRCLMLIRNGLVCSLIRDCAVSWRQAVLIYQMNQRVAARWWSGVVLPESASPPAGDCGGREGHQNHRPSRAINDGSSKLRTTRVSSSNPTPTVEPSCQMRTWLPSVR